MVFPAAVSVSTVILQIGSIAVAIIVFLSANAVYQQALRQSLYFLSNRIPRLLSLQFHPTRQEPPPVHCDSGASLSCARRVPPVCGGQSRAHGYKDFCLLLSL